MDRAALLHLLSLHPWLLQGQLAPPIDGLLGRLLSCFLSHSLGFQLQSHFLHLRSLVALSSHTFSHCCRSSSLSFSSSGRSKTILSCLMVRFCQPQARCLRGAPRRRRVEATHNIWTGAQMGRNLFSRALIHTYVTYGAVSDCHRPPTHKRVDPLSHTPLCPVPRSNRLSDWPRESINTQPRCTTQEQWCHAKQ